jgi:subtilisin family serine protease
MRRFIFWGGLALILAMAGNAAGQYYYSSGRQIPLRIDSTRVVIKLDDEPSPFDPAALMTAFARITALSKDPLPADGFFACSLSTGQGYDGFLDSLMMTEGVYLAEPYYLFGDSSEYVICDRFCVAFDSTITAAEIDSINALYGVVIDRQMEGMTNVYLLLNTDQSGRHLLDLANIYYELPETRWAHPDSRSYITLFGYKLYDYYNQYQPHLKKIIGTFNEKTVWDFAGLTRPLIAALVDNGVTFHDDLWYTRLAPGYNFCDANTHYEPTTYGYHGMACAGILAASHTTDSIAGFDTESGVIGMNPYLRVMPIKIYCDSAENEPGSFPGWASVAASAITYAWMNGAEVYSCSWGWEDPSRDDDILNEAIYNAFRLGRGGKGCPVIFAAGNSITYGRVAYPARLPYCFSVGAIDLQDVAFYWSQSGRDLDIVAPSSNGVVDPVWSIDQMGMAGINPIRWSDCPPAQNDMNYQCHFGGTSAACPLVAGTASLLLARDSNLTAEQVYDILRHSAVTELESGTITPPDMIYGWGRVDAFRAMLAITRGDANNSGRLELGDVVYINAYLFRNGPPPVLGLAMADANCDGEITLGDAVYIVAYIFRGGPPPGICYRYDY